MPAESRAGLWPGALLDSLGLGEGLWLSSEREKACGPAAPLCGTDTVTVGVRRLVSVHLSANADPAASALCVAMQLQARKGVALPPASAHSLSLHGAYPFTYCVDFLSL